MDGDSDTTYILPIIGFFAAVIAVIAAFFLLGALAGTIAVIILFLLCFWVLFRLLLDNGN